MFQLILEIVISLVHCQSFCNDEKLTSAGPHITTKEIDWELLGFDIQVPKKTNNQIASL